MHISIDLSEMLTEQYPDFTPSELIGFGINLQFRDGYGSAFSFNSTRYASNANACYQIGNLNQSSDANANAYVQNNYLFISPTETVSLADYGSAMYVLGGVIVLK